MLMKLKNMKVLDDDILMRFLIDTFDEITNNASVEKILEEVSKEKSELKLFESKELSLRFINSCKRNITNWKMMSLSLLDDTIALNTELFDDKVGSNEAAKMSACKRHVLRFEQDTFERRQPDRNIR